MYSQLCESATSTALIGETRLGMYLRYLIVCDIEQVA